MTTHAVDDVAPQVHEVLEVVLARPREDELRGLVRAETPDWDSLRHVELVLALEERFGIRFDASEVAELTSTAVITRAVTDKLSQLR